MSKKIEYKDVPIYFAHADLVEDEMTVVDNIIDRSVASGSVRKAIDAGDAAVTEGYKAGDSDVKSWADNKFATK